ncbi:polysaccharide pyruvyl transferase family protein [Microbacterium sp.]|uniref:polysaccharide pyruvyl transferase family protein n=1 Tax=Microbacterium sp. TaxID=51671 RepID=UPI003735CD93
MNTKATQNVFAHLAGQDDNLGDSALRIAYLDALRGSGRHLHVFIGTPTTDYGAGFPKAPDITYYVHRAEWVNAEKASVRPVHAFNAGEINPRPGIFPVPRRAAECARVLRSGGALIVSGIGVKDVGKLGQVTFDAAFRSASVFSWRDQGSRDAAGFGEFAPDWAYSLGAPVDEWTPRSARNLLAVTMRFDRPWPGDAWLADLKRLSATTGTKIVTLAQVARDAPRAVRLAEAVGGEYIVPASMRHDDLDVVARSIYSRSLAVVSDRAHGLIIGATEGAFPIGSGSDPQKIGRLLTAAGLGGLVGRYEELAEFTDRFSEHLDSLGPSISAARADVAHLTRTIRAAMDAVA